MKKIFGYIFLVLWIACLVGVIVTVQGSTFPYPTYYPSLFFAAVYLLPVWLFLLGGKWVRIITGVVYGFIIFTNLLYNFVLRAHKIKGGSMTPIFTQNVSVLSERVTYYTNDPKRGDVIVFVPPGRTPNDQFIARIIGLPGETISIRSGKVYIDNKILEEPYLQSGVTTEERGLITDINISIPQGNYFVMGDDRNNSYDSRDYGFIDKNSIIGRIFYIYSPASKRGPI